MQVLLFGKNGQVARCFREEATRHDLSALGSSECDLMVPGVGADAIRAVRPDIVVNATGYTAVDQAEVDMGAAMRLNASAPAELAAAAEAIGARFVHLSTDYVFNGESHYAYAETAPASPLNAYGRTKRDGELAVMAETPNAVILRTSWVFSEYGANFVKTMLRLGKERREIAVVSDQIGGPTPARDIARALVVITEKLHRGAGGEGLYHFQGAPAVSWAEFAREIFEAAALDMLVKDIATSDYPTAAQRPMRAILDCGKIERDFGAPQPDWRAGLRQVISSLAD